MVVLEKNHIASSLCPGLRSFQPHVHRMENVPALRARWASWVVLRLWGFSTKWRARSEMTPHSFQSFEEEPRMTKCSALGWSPVCFRTTSPFWVLSHSFPSAFIAKYMCYIFEENFRFFGFFLREKKLDLVNGKLDEIPIFCLA